MKTVLLIAAMAIPLHGQDRIVLYAGTIADLASTEYAISRGYREANPILGQNRLRRIGTATAVTVATDLLFHKFVAPRHPKIARVFNFSVGFVHFGATGWNLSATRIKGD